VEEEMEGRVRRSVEIGAKDGEGKFNIP